MCTAQQRSLTWLSVRFVIFYKNTCLVDDLSFFEWNIHVWLFYISVVSLYSCANLIALGLLVCISIFDFKHDQSSDISLWNIHNWVNIYSKWYYITKNIHIWLFVSIFVHVTFDHVHFRSFSLLLVVVLVQYIYRLI